MPYSIVNGKRQYRKTKIVKRGGLKKKKAATYRKKFNKRTGNHLNVSTSKMSGCALNFLKAQYNPWASFSESPCIPDLIATPSRKEAYELKFVWQSGTSGLGFIVVNPYLMIYGSDDTPGAVLNPHYSRPIASTNAAYETTSYGVRNAYDNGIAASASIDKSNPNSPFTSGDAMDYNIQQGRFDYRIVACGIKVKYAGAPLTRKGNYILYEDPTNAGFLYFGGDTVGSAPNFLNHTPANLMKEASAKLIPIDENEHAVLWHPRQQSDLDYISSWEEQGGVGGYLQAIAQYPTMGIFVYGADTTVDNLPSFSSHVIVHTEQVGTIVNNKTMTESDIVSLSKIMSNMATTVHTGNAQQQYYDKLKEIFHAKGVRGHPNLKSRR